MVGAVTGALAVVLAGCGTSASSERPGAATSPGTSAPGDPTARSATGPANWSAYHADQARTGAVGPMPSLDDLGRAWSVDLGGAVRGQPVVAGGLVIAATEGNRVVALDPATGSVTWSVSLGTPLTDVASTAGCGDIDPLGITSTPVVDLASNTVYVVGEISDGHGAVHRQLAGLDVTTGVVRLSEDVDPPLPDEEDAVHLLQRASLALGNGRVYIGYGGNVGDCGSYHGWLVAVNETGPARQVSFEVAPDGEGGAIWQSGGAPAVDADGNVYVSTGNANPQPPQGGPDPEKYTESVVKLSPDLQPLASFKDRIAGGDEDLSTGNPVLLHDGKVFSVGKTDVGYVLRSGDLSQLAAIPGVCGSDPDGGPAYDQATDRMFVPCRGGGIQVVNLDDATLGPTLSGADSAPIVVGPDVWAVDHSGGVLTEYNAATGTMEQTVQVGATIPIFTSPSVGLGLLLVATTRGVMAFR